MAYQQREAFPPQSFRFFSRLSEENRARIWKHYALPKGPVLHAVAVNNKTDIVNTVDPTWVVQGSCYRITSFPPVPLDILPTTLSLLHVNREARKTVLQGKKFAHLSYWQLPWNVPYLEGTMAAYHGLITQPGDTWRDRRRVPESKRVARKDPVLAGRKIEHSFFFVNWKDDSFYFPGFTEKNFEYTLRSQPFIMASIQNIALDTAFPLWDEKDFDKESHRDRVVLWRTSSKPRDRLARPDAAAHWGDQLPPEDYYSALWFDLGWRHSVKNGPGFNMPTWVLQLGERFPGVCRLTFVIPFDPYRVRDEFCATRLDRGQQNSVQVMVRDMCQLPQTEWGFQEFVPHLRRHWKPSATDEQTDPDNSEARPSVDEVAWLQATFKEIAGMATNTWDGPVLEIVEDYLGCLLSRQEPCEKEFRPLYYHRFSGQPTEHPLSVPARRVNRIGWLETRM
ncbi:hypothetical protein GGR56DRAFT_8833 [Xylariaceae sp. FL0804]|nr:hypothetical protein GGR56DRAFT_8833 [Xylariaceae sp. FL0804]